MVTNDSARPNFTGGLLALWIVVAAGNECIVHFTNLSIENMSLNWGDRTGLSTLLTLVISNALLIPVVALTQWLILRRGWSGMGWGEWLVVSAIAALTTGLVWFGLPISTIYFPLRLLFVVVGCGTAAAVAAVVLSRHEARPSTSILLFTCFLFGGAATNLLQLFDLTTLKSHLFIPVLHLLQTARHTLAGRPFPLLPWMQSVQLPDALSAVNLLVSLGDAAAAAGGAAISGFGLWMASQPDHRVSRFYKATQ
jgi:hypothetical protein